MAVSRFLPVTLALLLLTALTLLLPVRVPAAEKPLHLKDCIQLALAQAPETGEPPARIELKVKEYYYAAQLARATRELLNEVRGELIWTRDRAKKLLDQNSANVEETDLYQLDAFSGELAKTLAEVAMRENLALAALKTRIGLPPTAALELGGGRHFQMAEPMGELDGYLARQYDRLIANENFVEENIPPQIKKYHDVGVEAVSSMEATRGGYERSKTRAVTAMANFKFGVGPAREIFDALQQYAKMRRAHLQSVYNYNLALAHLSYAVGEGTR
jgi:outer membrane protein TolC